MTFTVVSELPKKARQKKLRNLLEEVMNMNAKFVKMDFDKNDYANPKSAQNSLSVAACRGGFPIKVHIIDGEVYFVRKDL